MKVSLVLLLAALSALAQARPLLIPPVHLELPLPGEPQYIGQLDPEYFYVAIDGDFVMASASRAINTDNERVNGVYIFQRAADGSWSFAGALTEGSQSLEPVLLNGNVATVWSAAGMRIYEHTAAGWALSATLTGTGDPIRIENGSIFTRAVRNGIGTCRPHEQYRKIDGSWRVVATIGAEDCRADFPDFNDGRALLPSQDVVGAQRPPVPLYRQAPGAWTLAANIPNPPPEGNTLPWLGPGTQNGNLMYFADRSIYRNGGNDSWQAAGDFTEPETDLHPNSRGAPILRGRNLLIPAPEGDYELPSHDIDFTFTWNTLRVYRPSASGALGYFARLNPDFSLWQWAVSEDGRRVAGTAATNNADFGPLTQLYVFEIPDSHTFPYLDQDNFETGNFSRWTPSAGEFSVVQSHGSRALRQASLAGDSGATFTSSDWTDQAIDADLRPLEFAGTDRWLGLVTRRTDDLNYYYATLRSPDVIYLRRLQNGVITNLGSGRMPEPMQPGRSYHVRMESVGDLHAVFVEGIPRVFAKDTALTHGRPGIAGYRTRFEADNVVVTGGTRLLTVMDSMDTFFNSAAYRRGSGTGTWVQVTIDDEQDSFHFYRRQTDITGTPRVFSLVPLTNQVVMARMQVQAFGATTATQDPWIGVAARMVDERNYLYLTLRRSNQLSLRRVVNGAIQVLATVPVTLTPQRWYDLRLEVIGNTARAFVDGDLKIETSDATLPASGRSGVLMYHTSADLWSYVTYQP